jgi:hypothetical protein
MESGPGKAYLPLYQKQQQQQQQQQQLVVLVPVKKKKPRLLLKVRLVVYSYNNSSNNTNTSHQSCQPVYYHIHKNGGTSMNLKDQQTPLLLADTYYTAQERALGRQAFENQTFSILKRIIETAQHSMPFFTFLRDPVPRFLSSIGQALQLNRLGPCHHHHHHHHHHHAQQNNNNSRDTTEELLDCVLNQIQETKSFLDEHLEPQAFELYHGMMGLDLTIKVMDLPAIGRVLNQLVVGSSSSTQATTTTTTTTVSRRKTRSVMAGFNMSLSVLTPSLRQRICEIYQMDVLLLQQTGGVSRTICDDVG